MQLLPAMHLCLVNMLNVVVFYVAVTYFDTFVNMMSDSMKYR